MIANWFLERDNKFTVLKWPPQSRGLSPIEHLLGGGEGGVPSREAGVLWCDE